MRRIRWILVTVGVIAVLGVGALLVLGRAPGHTCKMMGCSSMTTFQVDGTESYALGRTATFCVDDECVTGEWERLTFLSIPPLGSEQPTVAHSASFSIDGGTENLGRWDWKGDAASKELQPNGSRCEPTCYVLGFTVREGELVPSEA